MASVQAVNTFVSSLTLALIAMDRVLLTKYPVKWFLKICDRSYPEICMEMEDTWERAYISKTTFTITVLAIQYLLPLFALAYAYVQIGSTIRRRSKVSRTINQARRMSMQSRNRYGTLHNPHIVLWFAPHI
ncbi:unnamed protein product [Heligmosomoides polygyrus]|uniref:G_PROTEIN_RECEP_F1_2 domain-containing protein n=1 Tax=Heligmosomoides polygyrus TaxID=6339 RepID=A0A3P7YKK1_HELPZ|nr:unnamed protein product [Heligmosomoides polygyrus]